MRQTLDTDTTEEVDEQNRNVHNDNSFYFVAWISCRIWACVCAPPPFFPEVSGNGGRCRRHLDSDPRYVQACGRMPKIPRPHYRDLLCHCFVEKFGTQCQALQRGLSFYQLVVETQTSSATWTCSHDLDLSGMNHLVILALSDVTTCLRFPTAAELRFREIAVD